MSDSDKAKADKAAEDLLLPEGRLVKFLGREIRVRPLPVSAAKELRRLPDKLNELLVNLSKDDNKTSATDVDVTATDLYIETVSFLMNFYATGITKQYLEENCSLNMLKAFLDIQNDVQGQEDFLFTPLKNIMAFFFEKRKETTTPSA